jgi:hypothetical protein
MRPFKLPVKSLEKPKINSTLCPTPSTKWIWKRLFVGIAMNMVIFRDTARNYVAIEIGTETEIESPDRKYEDRLNLAYEGLDGDSLYFMNCGNFDNDGHDSEGQEYFAQIVHQMDDGTLICDLESEPCRFSSSI